MVEEKRNIPSTDTWFVFYLKTEINERPLVENWEKGNLTKF